MPERTDCLMRAAFESLCPPAAGLSGLARLDRPGFLTYGMIMDAGGWESSDATYDQVRQTALDFGIDLSITDYLLTLTPEQRLERHDQALELVIALRQAGIDYYGFDPRNPPQTEPTRG